MNLDEIRAMNPNDARKLSIEQLVGAIFEDVRIDASLPIERDEYQNPVRHVQRTEDAYGKVIAERIIRWTYHDTEEGIVDKIITNDGKVEETVSHTLDGRQPTLKRVPIAEPVPLEKLGGMGGAAVEPEPLILPVPLRVVEIIPEPVITEEPAIIEVPLTRWQRFKERAERIIFLLPSDVT